MARLLVDGYNVIRRDPALRELESRAGSLARAELVRLLNHPALARYQVTVVFDGAAPANDPPPRGSVKVRYSGAQKADALIARLCGPADVVVTDDRGLAADTLRAGPRVWSVAKLIALARPAGRKPSSPPATPVTEKPAPRAVRLRGFDVCPRCMFHDRDDWLRLCEEDSAHGAPSNFREHW